MELLQMENVSKRFLTREDSVQAVSHVSLTLQEGEILGVVGFSGSGKSTVLQLAAGLEKPEEGTIRWPVAADGHFYRHVQMVFQDPGAAFSPRMDIGTFLREPLLNFGLKTKGEAEEAIQKMMEEIGAPLDLLSRLPSEVSGGQLQRIVIARALLVRPDIILFDEPTSALDVITQQKILSLIIGEHEKYGFAGIFVTHDLSVVQQVSQRVMVMEEGKVVEILPAEDLTRGLHPCTRKLIHAQIPEDGHPIPDAEEEGVLVYDGKACTLVTDEETMKILRTKGKDKMISLSSHHMVRAYQI